MRRVASFGQIARLLLERLRLPAALFVVFHLLSVTVCVTLEGVSWFDALFWITHPHAIHPERVGTPTTLFALFVFAGVLFFQI